MLDHPHGGAAAPSYPALLPAVDTAETGRDILERVRYAIANAVLEVVETKRIRPMRDQPRKHFHPERLARLSDSIKTTGQITPGYLRAVPLDALGHDRELIDGERRWRAIIAGGIPTFRAMRIEIDDLAAQYVVSVIANFNRESHTPLEIADAIRVMHEQLKLSMEEIAETIGYSAMYTSALYGLRRLVPMVRAMLEPETAHKKKLPTTAAIEIARMPAARQYTLAEKVIRREVTLRTLRDEVVQISVKHDLPVARKIRDPHTERQSFERKADILYRAARDLRDRLEEARPNVLNDWAIANRTACLGILQNARDDIDGAMEVLKLVNRRKSR